MTGEIILYWLLGISIGLYIAAFATLMWLVVRIFRHVFRSFDD